MKPQKNIPLLVAIAKSGLRQQDLAKKAGVSRAVISMSVNGRYIPSKTHQQTIAKALNRPVAEIFPDK